MTSAEENPKQPKRITIYDVAKVAGVAPSTVSRAFSRPGRVNAQTGQRIREIAAELGYRTKPVTSADLGEDTNVLAFVVADISNPVFAQTMRGFQIEATKNGYTVLLIDSQEDDQQERSAIERVLHLVDGIVLTSSRMSDSSINQIKKVKPVVAVNRHAVGIPSIVPDTDQAVHEAVEHLRDLGHQRVTYLSGPAASWADGMRWRALAKSCEQFGLHLRRVGPNSPTLEGGVRGAKAWLQSPTSAVVCYNDVIAIGFIKAVQTRGFEVPEAVSVIGFDNSVASFFTTPSLSSIGPPSAKIGARAARTLISQLRHRSTPVAETQVVPMKLVLRESVGPAHPKF
ncbi:MAG: LacI family DNA-binding transcriptional regulator [Actinomycetaceae bacterium]|nr:LacI family DNA-binding transcriptional regulator [Actinomycetaceae bacterium]